MFRVFVDSAANLPAVKANQYGIHVISFQNQVNGKLITNFDPNLTEEEERAKGHEYYEAVRGGASIKTGLISTENFMDAFRTALSAGEDVLYICLSKNISGTFNSARIAEEILEEEFPDRKIRIVDSLNASLAQGIPALYAVELRDNKGMEVDEVADLLDAAAGSMNGVFTVDSLKYLVSTGRVKNVEAMLSSVLILKVILRGNAEGFITSFNICRGRKKALAKLADLVCDNIVEPEKQIIGIAQADCYEESLDVMRRITERVHVREFINTSYDYCTGTHVGPGTIALFFMGTNRELTGQKEGSAPALLDVL